MNDINLEKNIKNYPIPVSFKKTKDILFQMENCICKIIKSNGEEGKGFFCKIPLDNKNNYITMLATNNHILNKEDIQNGKEIELFLKDNNEKKIIEIVKSRKTFTSVELDVTFIQIKPFFDDIFDFLEIEEDIINKNKNELELEYRNSSIYILHYLNEVKVSYGIINSIINEDINHYCNTDHGSSGSPILSLNTFKVIGIHCGSSIRSNFNKGILIKNILNEFYNYNNNNNIIYNNYNYNFIYYKSWNEVDHNYINEYKEEHNGEMPAIAIEIGEDYCNVGFGGEEGPKVCFPPCIGYRKDKINNEYFIGLNALEKRFELNINFPFKNGKIRNHDETEKIFDYIFKNELKINPSNHNIMLFDIIINDKESREIIAEILFKTFKVKGLYIATSEKCGLCSYGKFTGIVINLGERETTMVPIYDFNLINNNKIKLPIGGNYINEYLMKLINEGFNSSNEYKEEIIKDIKEKGCYVAYDFENELNSIKSFDYELPDGNHLIIKDQRIKCYEVFFKSSIINNEKYDNIGKKIVFEIEKCGDKFKRDFYNRIILCGNKSMIEGFPKRLEKEIKYFAPEDMKELVRVIAIPERKFGIWIGGSVLSSLISFESKLFTRTEYELNPQKFSPLL